MIFSVFGGSLISFVMWNSSFLLLLLSLSDQNSKKEFTFWRKFEVTVGGGGYWHLREMWRRLQFQFINKTRCVLHTLSGCKYYKLNVTIRFLGSLEFLRDCYRIVEDFKKMFWWGIEVVEQQTKGNQPWHNPVSVMRPTHFYCHTFKIKNSPHRKNAQ